MIGDAKKETTSRKFKLAANSKLSILDINNLRLNIWRNKCIT